MSKKYDPAWENALTVVQEVQPAVHPRRRARHDRRHRLPARQCGRPAAPAPERAGLRLHAGRRDAVRAGRAATARHLARARRFGSPAAT